MPAYSATGTVYSPQYGDRQVVWSAETITTASKSQQVALPPAADGAPFMIAFDITFSGAPGTFTVTPQTANQDVDGDYVNILGGAMNSVTGSSGNTCNYQAQVQARFARLVMTTQPSNSVTVTAAISR